MFTTAHKQMLQEGEGAGAGRGDDLAAIRVDDRQRPICESRLRPWSAWSPTA
jgi:hypothetical protein